MFFLFSPKRALAALERQFIFFPESGIAALPSAVGLSFKEVQFQSEDDTELYGWFIPGEQSAPAVLFFHGNAGNISHRLENLALLNRLGLNVFIFDYRGYGKSKGKPSEKGLYADGRAALEWLRNKGWPPEKTIYFGRSLGAAAALQLALDSKPAGLILESPFESINAMGRRHYPILFRLLGWALNAEFDNLAKIDQIHAPLLIIQGDMDQVVPQDMAEKLFKKALEPKKYYLIKGAGHNNTYSVGGVAYWQTWREFMQKIFDRPAEN